MKAMKYRHIHFVGIKGVAMTSLALYFHDQGVKITGSDVKGIFPTQHVLDKTHVSISEGFSVNTIDKQKNLDLVIYTGAHGGKDNIEVMTAAEKGIPVMSHGQALGMVMDGNRKISVAGSHGKTTTSAMLATIFSKAGLDPSYAIGCGEILGLGNPGHYGRGNVFIAEADEYITDPGHDARPRFLWQHPEVLVVTNIDYDHPDAYANLEDVQKAFLTLQNQITGRKTTIVNHDDVPSSVLCQKNIHTVTYGYSQNSEYQIIHVSFEEGRTFFTVAVGGTTIGEFVLAVPGKHNILNALAALVAAHEFGLSYETIKKGLMQFKGAKRRLEIIYTDKDIQIYDDYAHHPHEIIASLDALRAWYPKSRIITIFQPHTYSRTASLLSEFAKSFSKSDIVLIADIYASAREEVRSDITSATLVEEISKYHTSVQYVKDLLGVMGYIKKHLSPGDIIVCMGAGDIYEWSYAIASQI
ncbi:MAG: UDP-N-acetylmuramate-L-alanine ligase [Microgenomates group bacterium GW2011_GWC1_39_12]|nr:MAG: UDP-N-acetylmuramate-L-alanine ligase [Microgenomates group bacterium GW2011_GWC1_39_12]